MSRELGPIELGICRLVFAFLGSMVSAFLLVSAIEFLSSSSPPVGKIERQPDITKQTGPNPKQLSQSTPSLRAVTAPLQKELAQGAADDPAQVALAKLKLFLQMRETASVQKSSQFDPLHLEPRFGGNTPVAPDALTKPTLAEIQERPEGATAQFATAEPLSFAPHEEKRPQPQVWVPASQGGSNDSSLGVGSLSSEDVRQIQSRLRALRFLSSANDGEWDVSSRDALRDFKVVNHLASDDVWDPQTRAKLNSQTAIRADQSFIGSWSKAPCQSAGNKDNLRLSINSRRAKSSAGTVCELHDFASDHRVWRVRATCLQNNQRWTAKGEFRLKANKLVWSSEPDVISYFRCN